MRRVLFTALSIALAGCLGPTDSQNTVTLDFDFNVHGDGWTGFIADVPAANVAAVGFVGELRPLPASVSTTNQALYLKGTNTSGDLFLYQTKYIPGLAPNAPYHGSLQVNFVTNYGAGCTTGPGPLTVIKAGLAEISTEPTTDGQGVLRLPVDKGAGLSAGQYTQLGDIRNTVPGCATPGEFAGKQSGLLSQPLNFTTDIQGGFFIFLGTQSSFVGTHEIYFTNLRLVLD